MQLNVYLGFNGQCEEALTFYQSVLGGEMTAMMPIKGSPMEEQFPPAHRGGILHGCLALDNMMIMGSDAGAANYEKPSSVSICINLEDGAEADRLFSALSEGGEVRMPLSETFFAKKFGEFTDRFGVKWLINCA